jgi:glycosyltransferase involved in cell wall biosynthesis
VNLAVDAYNLAADRRGMGRYVRQVFRGLQTLGENDVRLVVRNKRAGESVTSEFPYPLIEARDLRRDPADAAWYPWNGIRFHPHAPAIATIYDTFAFTFPHKSFFARRKEQQPILRAVREAQAIVTISRWSATQLQERFGIEPGRITIAPPAVEPFWHPEAPERDSPYVLFVAGPDERKNARVLFEAFEAAFEDDAVELLAAGELNRDDEAAFARMHAKKSRVQPSDRELRSLYSGATAVAVPSLAEGFGLPAIEAMACGAPVVASDAAALPEACGGAAWLVDPLDPIAWRDALRRIYVDAQLRTRLRDAGLARAAALDPIAPARVLARLVHDLAQLRDKHVR